MNNSKEKTEQKIENFSELEFAAIELSQIFTHRYSWIRGKGNPITGENVRWIHPKGKLSNEELISNWEQPDIFIGVGFGTFTNYALLDTDEGGNCHSYEIRLQLESKLKPYGVNAVIWIPSSGSGGYHGYIPFKGQISSWGCACLLTKIFAEAGFATSDGNLEIFPHLKHYNSDYKAHRLPCQSGSGADLYTFIDNWYEAAEINDIDLFNSFIPEAIEWKSNFKKNHTSNSGHYKAHLLEVIETGWTASGQTNEIIKKVTHYHRIFNSDCTSEDKLFLAVSHTIKSMKGWDTYSSHLHDLDLRCRDWAKACFKRNFLYKPESTPYLKKSPQSNKNLLSKESSREKIKRAVEALTALSQDISIRAVAEEAGVSKNTVSKHKDLLETKSSTKSSTKSEENPNRKNSKNPQRKHNQSYTHSKRYGTPAPNLDQIDISANLRYGTVDPNTKVSHTPVQHQSPPLFQVSHTFKNNEQEQKGMGQEEYLTKIRFPDFPKTWKEVIEKYGTPKLKLTITEKKLNKILEHTKKHQEYTNSKDFYVDLALDLGVEI